MDWFKGVTREFSFYMVHHIMKAYINMKTVLGFTLNDALVYVKDGIMTIFRSKSQLEEFNKIMENLPQERIDFIVKKALEYHMEIQEQIKKPFSIESAIELDQLIEKVWPYNYFCVLSGYVGNRPKLAKKLKKHKKTCDVIRNMDSLWRSERYLRQNIKADFDPLLLKSDELIDYLKNKHIRDVLEKRKNYLYRIHDGTIKEIKEMKRIFDNELSRFYSMPNEIHGTTSCPGKAQGIVRIIIKEKDLKPLTKDEILVTHMTTPNFIPYLENVGGIITDDGGVTSHASIISRELNIPCLTGTGNATIFFKDGDRIMLDAEKGVAKKL